VGILERKMRKTNDILEGVLAEIENNLKDGINADVLADELYPSKRPLLPSGNKAK
jgi:hypothetical protein